MMLSDAAKELSSPMVGDDVLFSGCSTDSRSELHDKLFIALKGENFDGHDFIEQAETAKASALLVSKSIKSKLPSIVVEDTKLAMGQLASIWRDKFNAPLVAITGSNGKTTVKEMLSSILNQNHNVLVTQGNFNNDIGMPLTLFGLGEQHEYIVLEMGANHLGEIDYLSKLAKPNVAVITQCAPAHLEGFGSIDGVAEAKSEIYHGLNDDGIAIINADDDYAEFWLNKTQHLKSLTFGMNKQADVFASNIELSQITKNYCFTLNYQTESISIQLPVSGMHNIMNALAAASCAISLNIPFEMIQSGLESFAGVKGRLQIKEAANGATLIDDSYNANPTSLLAAMKYLVSLGEDSFLVLGEMGELGDDAEFLHAKAGQQAKQLGIKYLFTVGTLAMHASESFGDDSKHYESKAELSKDVLLKSSKDSKILVKGSRSMKLEEIVDALIQGEDNQC